MAFPHHSIGPNLQNLPCKRQLPCCQKLTRPYANLKDSLQELNRSVNVACFAHTMLLLL